MHSKPRTVHLEDKTRRRRVSHKLNLHRHIIDVLWDIIPSYVNSITQFKWEPSNIDAKPAISIFVYTVFAARKGKDWVGECNISNNRISNGWHWTH